MKNNRPPILQSDWSIASRHGRIFVKGSELKLELQSIFTLELELKQD